MEYKKLASGEKIPSLGLGTWHMGGNFSADYSQDEKYIEAISYAISKGITHIDTAEIYSGGHAEELIGEAIRQSSTLRSSDPNGLAEKINRKNLFLTSKVSPQHLFTSGQIKRSCEGSLSRDRKSVV